MKRSAAPLRFLALVVGGWTIGRAAFLLPGLGADSDETAVAVAVAGPETALLPGKATRAPTALSPPAASPAVALAEPAKPQARGGITIALDESADDTPPIATEEAPRLASIDIIPSPPPVAPRPAPRGSSPLPRSSRWSGSAWLYVRPDEGGSGLATGGQLGGSQAGVRLAHRIAGIGPGSLALAGRLSTPLKERHGAEAAMGVDWHPSAKNAFRISVERRVALGEEGRNAWSAYAAGGFWRGDLPAGLEADGYAQAGAVGARSRDLFADGALRVGRATPLTGGRRLVLGAGAWGAAQPGLSRLDVGPRAALSVPLAGATITGSLDWRFRVAGTAEPHSGAAFTLAADF